MRRRKESLPIEPRWLQIACVVACRFTRSCLALECGPKITLVRKAPFPLSVACVEKIFFVLARDRTTVVRNNIIDMYRAKFTIVNLFWARSVKITAVRHFAVHGLEGSNAHDVGIYA